MALISDKTSGRGSLHNPFRTYSNFIYPRTIEQVFLWALWFWDRNAKYRSAIQKVVSYFISGIHVVATNENQEEVDPDSVDDLEECLLQDYNIMEETNRFGIELAAMGNAFVSAERIFTRTLLCPNKKCSWQMGIKMLRKGREYEWDGKNFIGVCPQCHKKVTFMYHDTPSQMEDGRKVRFVFRDPQDMSVQYNHLTGSYKYLYKMPGYIKDAIKRGDQVYLEDTPRVFLEAASTDDYIEFPRDAFFHDRTLTLSALDKLYQGWGVPLFMTSFDNLIRLQHLDKFNEAVTMDYIAPTRMLSPQPANLKAGSDDPNRMPISGAFFSAFMRDSLRRVKENPTTWVISPFPVQYQMLGGEAKQLAPVDLMEWYTTQILADMGIPQEFKQTTFQVAAPTMGLRMFERQWVSYTKSLHAFVKWFGDMVCEAERIDNMRVALDVTSFIEDDMNKQVVTGLMQGGFISKTGVLKRYGINWEDDLKQQMAERKKEAEMAAEMQKSQENKELVDSVLPPAGSVGVGQAQMNIQMMQQAAQGGQGMPAQPGQPAAPAAPAGGGAPMPYNQGNSQSAAVEDLFMKAQDEANRIYALPPTERRRALIELKSTDEALHNQVIAFLRDMEQQIASDAVAQSKQPQG